MDRSQLKQAIEIFRTTGNDQACFDALGLDRSRQPLMALQQALTYAESRDERDVLEDLSFLVSRPGSFNIPAQRVIDDVVQEASRLYGPYLTHFVDIPPLVVGMYRTSETVPPINSILAVIGILAERAVASSLKVRPEQFGETLELFKNNCDHCNGTGYICCRHCLRQVRSQLDLLALERLMRHWEGSEDQLIQQYLVQNSEDFGCRHCRQKPVSAW